MLNQSPVFKPPEHDIVLLIVKTFEIKFVLCSRLARAQNIF